MKKWPKKAEVFESFRHWASRQLSSRSTVEKIGCFGSLVNGTWGMGSDIDILIIVDDSLHAVPERAAEWDTNELPVEADVVVLTKSEAAGNASKRFRNIIENETVWVANRIDTPQSKKRNS